MTTNVEAATPTALHAELLAAAGPERILTPAALRQLLVGVNKSVLTEALSRVVRDGVILPPAVAAQFGVPAGGDAPPGPNGPGPGPAHMPDTAPPSSGLPALPAQKAPGPRFTVELGPDSRLDLTALTVRTLRPEPVPSPPAPKSPPRPASRSADAGFEDSDTGRPVFNPWKYYRKVIGAFPLLSRQQEAELAQAIEAGLLAREKLDEGSRKLAPKLRWELEQLVHIGERAFTDFSQANLRLVVSVATRYTGRGLDLMDLVQEGNIGLLHAIDKFDHRKGFKLSTYAVPWIRQAISRAIADQSRTVRLPVHAHDTVSALGKAARELGHPTPEAALPAVAARAGITPDEARTLLSRVRRTVPLEELTEAIGDDMLHAEADRSTRGPHWAEPDAYYRNMSAEEVHALLSSSLTQREHQVMVLRHGLGGGPELTLEVIGRELGVTRERIRQIESKAVAKLLGGIQEYRTRTTGPADAPPSPVLRARRKVYPPGIVVVGHQTIHVGGQWCRKMVTVLIEDDWFRVVDGGHQIAAAPRRHLVEARQIYGVVA
ncbi:sigma-70 family RNA polymerase sigma factor [Streptomyces sp. H28]|uniref:sigma-70 family RNA polymerase sigma factor n=1 Tax=Streptomyces sp. H28 TaxID=2775865 RepID=UPI00177B9E23|nr:sigma-70 family RNA polymerase sigma factor [Streptomyces sp. H28]MBD9730590.1 sigma-70 family RNA polymerase sigma factor [Streptomyces sp. H28]